MSIAKRETRFAIASGPAFDGTGRISYKVFDKKTGTVVAKTRKQDRAVLYLREAKSTERQPFQALKNMIMALEMLPFENTNLDDVRLAAAKIVKGK
jgi:hypothetical protein